MSAIDSQVRKGAGEGLGGTGEQSEGGREGGSWREDRGKEVLRKRRRERRAKEMDGSGRGLKRVGGVVLTRVEERRC